ncbi:MAG: DUF3090 family protein [Actinomycetota bacterium]|nr:DUF3090 family protein [Actinomycetota bacterium]
MSISRDFPSVDHVALGAIGEPGKRVFLIQARYLGDLVTLKVEKAQVAALVRHLGELIQELPRPGHLEEPSDLIVPYVIAWVVGSISISYTEGVDQVHLNLEEIATDDSEPSTLQIGLSREQSAEIAIQGMRLVEAGRPPCPLCGYPLDPNGHACPRTNGHRAPAL